MKYDSLELMCCPTCKGELLLLKARRGRWVIQEGSLYCKGCGLDFPIKKGIPRFISPRGLAGPNKKFERVYNWMSHLYDSDFFLASRVRRRFWPCGEEQARREVIEGLELEENSKVLETGIGTGGNLPYLASSADGIEIYGLDISEGMLRQCAKNLERGNLQADLFLGNAEELPFKEECFDVVFHLGGINFFTQKRKAIQEMIRVAKPGTRIVIADETEKLIGGGTIFSKLSLRLVYGRQLAQEILRFRSQDMLKLIPENMADIGFDYIWQGYGYRLEFRKP